MMATATLPQTDGAALWWLIGAFVFFNFLVFPRAVPPNVAYIMAHERKAFWHCMRPPTWLIVVFMMSLGISVRYFGLGSPEFIGGFYRGLGISLLLCVRYYVRPLYQLLILKGDDRQ